VNDPNDIFDGSAAFPFEDVSKSANPDAAELVNRSDPKDTPKDRSNGKPVGRPAKLKSKAEQKDQDAAATFRRLFDPENPDRTAIAVEDDHLWLGGSILRIEFDEGPKTFVLAEDVMVLPIDIADEPNEETNKNKGENEE